MSFSYVVSIWKHGGPGPGRSSADFIVPVCVLVPAGAVPDLASLVPDMLNAYELVSAHLVRFADSSGMNTDYWYPHIFA